jgi:hypothetical protein
MAATRKAKADRVPDALKVARDIEALVADLLKRIHKGTAKDGPEAERIRAALRIALAAPDPKKGNDRGVAAGAVHCAALAEINLKGSPDLLYAEPESASTYLLYAADYLSGFLAFLALELGRAELRMRRAA